MRLLIVFKIVHEQDHTEDYESDPSMKKEKQVDDKAMPWLRQLVVSFPPQWLRFDSSTGHIVFVVD